jgi:hypothetical protein
MTLRNDLCWLPVYQHLTCRADVAAHMNIGWKTSEPCGAAQPYAAIKNDFHFRQRPQRIQDTPL